LRRKPVAIVLITIIIVSVATLLLYNQISELKSQIEELKAQNGELQEQNRELQNQTSKLQNQNDILKLKVNGQKIGISFFSLNGYDNPVGVMWNTKFIVRVQNNSTKDVSGLTLTFNIVSNYTIKRELYLFQPNTTGLKVGEKYDLGILKQGETQEVQGIIWNNLGDSAKLRGSTFMVTLKLADVILDESSIPSAG
jgi:regulator of replication initiation timing